MTKPFLSDQQQQRLSVVNKTLLGQYTNNQAAKILGISLRQIKRLKKNVRVSGEKAVVHGLLGKPSNHRLSPLLRKKVLDIVQKQYADFKPTLAAEKLRENNQLSVHPQTLRRWMSSEGLWKIHQAPKPQKYRSWRPRKECLGEMQQFDGSYHFWFENRWINKKGNKLESCLLAAIDDATGKITGACFRDNESVFSVFGFWKEYLWENGKPLSIYLDRYSTYKINHKNAVDNQELLTHFEKAAKDLGISLITAYSPQAKGRIERLFKTLQDRLVKEMRLAKINNPKAGNIFLKEVFLPKFNQMFSVRPQQPQNLHRSLTTQEKRRINSIFSLQSTRKINNDYTIVFKNRWYQLLEIQKVSLRPGNTIGVEEWINNSLHFSFKGQYLNYTRLPKRPERVSKKQPLLLTTHRLNWKPPKDHPWNKSYKTMW